MAQGGGVTGMKIDEVVKALAQAQPEAVVQTDYAAKGFFLDVRVTPERLVACVSVLDGLGFFIETITGVDWLGEKAARLRDAQAALKAAAKAAAEAAKAEQAQDGDGAAEDGKKIVRKTAPPAVVPGPEPELEPGPDDMEVVYDFNRFDVSCRVVVRTRVSRDNPEVPTIADIYPAAHWHERETHDFFGVKFAGHPYLIPLLLPEDADFHPLRKDFKS